MKSKLILICCTFLFISCLPFESDDENKIGVMFDIDNRSNSEYHNSKITIGGMQNGNFIGTESYKLPILRVNENTSVAQSQIIAVGSNRWMPNLVLIKEISYRAYFTVQLEGEIPVLLYDYDALVDDTLVSVKIIDSEENLKNKFGGDLYISINENYIKGYYGEHIFSPR